MSSTGELGDLAPKIVSLHEMLDSAGAPHQFGGAIALAWYRNPRATTDIDLNLTLPPAAAEPVVGLLGGLGVTVTPEDRAAIEQDGQVRLDWDGSYLDVFFATMDLHLEMAEDARLVRSARSTSRSSPPSTSSSARASSTARRTGSTSTRSSAGAPRSTPP